MRINYLNKWQEIIHTLRDKGIITQEEIDQGYNIPIDCLHSEQIDNEIIKVALFDLYRRGDKRQYDLKAFLEMVCLQYFEDKGKPCLEIKTPEKSIWISEDAVKKDGSLCGNRTMFQLCERMKYAKKSKWVERTMEVEGITEREASIKYARSLPYRISEEPEQMARILIEMAINYGKYCENLANRKKTEQPQVKTIKEPKQGPIIIDTGIVLDPETDGNSAIDESPNSSKNKPKTQIRSGITGLAEREAMYNRLDPIFILNFDGKDPTTKKIIKCTNVCYVYENPQNNEGYFIVSEPLKGNKLIRCMFFTKDMVKKHQGNGGNLQDTLTDLAKPYLEKAISDFRKEEGTQIFNHSGGIEALEAKIRGLIEGYDPGTRQAATVRKAIRNLFGKDALKQILMRSRLTRSRLENAKKAILGAEIKKEGLNK